MNELVSARPNEIVATSNSGALLNIIERAAFDASVDIARLEMLFNMHRQVLADEAKALFAIAMSAAQGEIEPVAKDAQNQETKAKYARLEAILAAISPIYTKHGFSLSFNQTESLDKQVSITCRLAHAGGHSESYTLSGSLDNAGIRGTTNKTPIQAMGSTITYLRRYLTCMIFNVSIKDEDNDGNHQHNRAHLVLINPEQKSAITELLAKLKSYGVETETFYSWITDSMNAETIDDLKASDYPRVMTALNNKLKGAAAL
jgi:hypothetical protein